MTPEELLEIALDKEVCIQCHSKQDRQALEDFMIKTGWHLGFNNNDYPKCMYLRFSGYHASNKEIHGNYESRGMTVVDIYDVLRPAQEVLVDDEWLSSQLFVE